MGEVRVRTAGADDALVLAALALQCALHRGGSTEQGFLDRYARAWLADRRERPAWLAEAGEEHGGFLQALVLESLPVPGEPPRSTLAVETFFVRASHRGMGVGEQLLRAAVAWARDGGFAEVRVPAGRHTTVMVERVGFTADERAYRMELP